jgi:Uma2 family endonuclease
MEAIKLKTVEDLLLSEDERVELINGEIVKRPMSRFEHGQTQTSLSDEVIVFKHKSGPEGWWIITEASVKYSEHQCPSHDLAGWKKERVPDRPTGIAKIKPDWVCEITSPGYERKDVFHNLLLLQDYEVPYYWIISPEDKTLIAYKLINRKYNIIFSMRYEASETGVRIFEKVRIEPFEEIKIDLDYVFTGEKRTGSNFDQ